MMDVMQAVIEQEICSMRDTPPLPSVTDSCQGLVRNERISIEGDQPWTHFGPQH